MSGVMFFGIQAIFIGGLFIVFALVSRVVAENKAKEAADDLRPDGEAAALPRFFSQEGSLPVRGRKSTLDDLVVERLEGYLRLENARAEEFVSEPSFAKLYQDSERRFHFN